MKKTLLALMCLPLVSLAQNGGQIAENESLKLQIVGSVGNKTIIQVTNKQHCVTDIKFYHDGITTTKQFNCLASDTFQVTLADCSVKAKPLSNCGGANMGWVEWNVCVALPIKFEWITTTQLDKNTIEVKFKPSVVEGKEFYIQVSSDGLNFKRAAIILPKDVQVGQIYSAKVKIQ